METSRRKWLQAIGTSTAVLGTGATVISAQQEDGGMEAASERGALRVAHFSADAPAVDVYVDDESVLTDVSYTTVSDYLSVEAGDRSVRITAAGDESTVPFEGTVTVEANRAYTAAATGSVQDGSFDVSVLSDFPIATLRLLHAVSGADAVDVVTGGEQTQTVLFENAQFGEASEYIQIPAGTSTVTVRPTTGDGSGEPLVETELEFQPGGVYTVVARGVGAGEMGAGAGTNQTAEGTTATPTPSGGEETNETATPSGEGTNETATATPSGQETATATPGTESGDETVALELVPDVSTTETDILSLFESASGATDEGEETEEETETEPGEETEEGTETETPTETETETPTETETETPTETGTETPTETGTNETATPSGGGTNETATGTGTETATETPTETPNGG